MYDISGLFRALIICIDKEDLTYPLGLYKFDTVEPLAQLKDIVDAEGLRFKESDYEILLEQDLFKGSTMIYEYNNTNSNIYSIEPFIPYIPGILLKEYIQRTLDSFLEDKEIGSRCPFNNDGPIIYTETLTITALAYAGYNIDIKDDTIDDIIEILVLELISVLDDLDVMSYEVSFIGERVMFHPKGSIYEIRYENLLRDLRRDS